MSAAGAIFGPATRLAIKTMGQSIKVLRQKVAAAASRPFNAELQTVTATVRVSGPRQPIHPAALLRQQKRGAVRWASSGAKGSSGQSFTAYLHTAVRRYLSTESRAAGRFDRSKFPVSNVSRAVSQLTGRTPFASALRPNLTGGALPRTAGGYGVPGSGRVGGARYFSHTPAAPAQVVQNVSQAMRAFWLSGQRARFDGTDARGGAKYRAVSALQAETASKMAAASARSRRVPGSFVDFRISPTVTALSPLAAAFPYPAAASAGGKGGEEIEGVVGCGLNAEGLLSDISADFARALNDLAAVMADLERLAKLGDLPLELLSPTVLRVRMPGVDVDTAEALCDDVGLERGVVGQDPDFEKHNGVNVALKFPYAPTDGLVSHGAGYNDNTHGMTGYYEKTLTSPGGSLRSHLSELSSLSSEDRDDVVLMEEYLRQNPWLTGQSSPSSPTEEGYDSMGSTPPLMTPKTDGDGRSGGSNFEGLEGIYRFLEECDRPRPRF